MFRKILIANRGEIAARVIRTCHRLGIETVAVYSRADKNALHVEMADESFELGAAESAESYLNMERIIDAAKQTGAEAIHPGYGFLSENAEFASLLDKNGIVFIGPHPETIALLGNKVEAKNLAQKAGVPLVPGFTFTDNSSAPQKVAKSVQKFADEFGFPVLIKAAAGGGGRGMRIVRESSELAEALVSAGREAQAFFGSGEVFVEKLVEGARHIEIQILGDKHGNIFHFFDRDCSLQRNHQKVIEEAPAPGLSDHVRADLYDCAIKLCKAANYINAGTVEFLLDQDQKFYFLEVNSRLQVEHPVTEAITGVDLVELQIRAAWGDDLSSDMAVALPAKPMGHAIECRICAEIPEKDFQASTGTLREFDFHFSNVNEDARLDSGFRKGDRVTHYYDSLLAKLIVHRSNRNDSIGACRKILSQASLFGVNTNLGFLQDLLAHPQFLQCAMSTRLADKILEDHTKCELRKFIYAAFVLASRADFESYTHGSSEHTDHRHGHCWRLSGSDQVEHFVTIDSKNFRLGLSAGSYGYLIRDLNSPEFHAELTLSPDSSSTGSSRCLRYRIFRLGLGTRGRSPGHIPLVGSIRVFPVPSAPDGNGNHFISGPFGVSIVSQWRPALKTDISIEEDLVLQITAPLPGKVISVSTEEGGTVEEGQVLIVMESMKMEHPIRSDRRAMVKKLKVGVGDIVDANRVLMELDQGNS